MTYSPRVVLADILTHLGKAALDDAKRFEALLKDLCPDRRSDVQVLALALRHGLVRQILQGRGDVPPQILRSRFADGLHRDFGIDREIAARSADCWWTALGVAGFRVTSLGDGADDADCDLLGPLAPTLECRPQSVALWQAQGDSLCQLQRPEEALESYCLGIISQGLSLAFDLSPDEALRWRQSLRSDRRPQLRGCFDRALALDSSCAPLWKSLGEMLEAEEKWDDAAQCYSRALALRKSDGWTWRHKAACLRQGPAYEEQLECYLHILGAYPEDRTTLLDAAGALMALDRPAEAEDYYGRVLDVEPDDARTWKHKGDVLCRLKRYQEATVCYDRALALDPGDWHLWRDQGAVLVFLRGYEEALECYHRALSLEPGDWHLWRELVDVLLCLDYYKEAQRCLDWATRLATMGARTSHRPEQYPQASESQEAAPSIITNEKDGAQMVWVPAGEFLMGSTDEEIARQLKADSSLKARTYDREKPQRSVYLDGYWIYKTEVTVAQYRNFCEATNREMPDAPPWGWKEDHPVVNVSWQDAADYAQWAGASLPTEAQWEKAARGTDGRENPWGGQWPPKEKVGNFCDESLARDTSELAKVCRQKVSEIGVTPLRGYDDGYVFTSPVGSYPAGASPYGCLDMAGNVCEWCADWYDEAYYAKAPSRNPQGPTSGSSRVLRGGSWIIDSFRCAYRYKCSPGNRYLFLGFRCARTL